MGKLDAGNIVYLGNDYESVSTESNTMISLGLAEEKGDKRTSILSRFTEGKAKCWCVAGTALAAVAAVTTVTILILLLTRHRINGGAERTINGDEKLFTFEDIFDKSFRIRHFSATWIGDGHAYVYENSDGDVMEVDAETGSEILFMSAEVMKAAGPGTYSISPDADYVLIAYDRKSKWRSSFTAKYKVFVRNSSEVIDFPGGSNAGNTLDYAGWSSNGHNLTFVIDHDLYFQSTPEGEPQRLTTTGKPAVIFNGIADWLYEEEILSASKANYLSPDGSHIVYATFNDTAVELIEFPVYGDEGDMYGEINRIHYPKAGGLTEEGKPTPIPSVRLHVASTENVDGSGSHTSLDPPAEFADKEHYFTQVTWLDISHVLITWVNRPQNQSIVVVCDISSGDCSENWKETISNGWVAVMFNDLYVVGNGDSYLTVLNQDQGKDGVWRQVALVSAEVGETGNITFLTTGATEVSSITGYDHQRHLVYYASNGGRTEENQVYRVGTPEAKPDDQHTICMTCDDPCEYTHISLSPDKMYYINTCWGPGVPTYTLKSLQENKSVVALEDNKDFKEQLESKDLPVSQFIDIDIGGGYKGRAEILIPPNHQPGNRYRLLVYTYAGPESQKVVSRFPMGSDMLNWLVYMGSSHKVLVAMMDGRGTRGRGEDFKRLMYRQLGTVEVEDQILGAEYLMKLPEVDENERVAILGWSYGGFVVGQALGRDSQTYECGISVAPVTSFRYYDSAYTERYMGFATDNDNASGYNDTDITRMAHNFIGKKLLLAHGSADDNVHFQNTAKLTKALSRVNYQFKQLIYIDEDHGIRESRQHLHQALTDFLFNDCWGDI